MHHLLIRESAQPPAQVGQVSRANVVGGPLTNATYVNGVPLDQVQPEGAMGHFKGSNPNGVWTLAITDMRGGADSGSLDSWQLGVYTKQCNALYLPAVER